MKVCTSFMLLLILQPKTWRTKEVVICNTRKLRLLNKLQCGPAWVKLWPMTLATNNTTSMQSFKKKKRETFTSRLVHHPQIRKSKQSDSLNTMATFQLKQSGWAPKPSCIKKVGIVSLPLKSLTMQDKLKSTQLSHKEILRWLNHTQLSVSLGMPAPGVTILAFVMKNRR